MASVVNVVSMIAGLVICGVLVNKSTTPRLAWAKCLIAGGTMFYIWVCAGWAAQCSKGYVGGVLFLPPYFYGAVMIAAGILLLLWKWIDKDSFDKFSGEDYTEIPADEAVKFSLSAKTEELPVGQSVKLSVGENYDEFLPVNR
jgi:hypothetical protein